jgi:hypothetical protein
MFFSEEKNQKTLMFSAASTYPAMAGMHPLAQTQKSFASCRAGFRLLQKRTFLPYLASRPTSLTGIDL